MKHLLTLLLFISTSVMADEPFNRAEEYYNCLNNLINNPEQGSIWEIDKICGKPPSYEEKKALEKEDQRRIQESRDEMERKEQEKKDAFLYEYQLRKQAEQDYLNSPEGKKETKRKQKIQTKCANKASKAESDVGASLVYSACLKENNYY